MSMIYYEDLEVGSTSKFGRYDVTRDEVMEFARKYDPQPFHLEGFQNRPSVDVSASHQLPI